MKDIAIWGVNLGFDFRTDQTGHGVTNGWPPLRHFFGAVLSVAQALSRGDGPGARYTLRRNTVSIMKI